MPDFHSSRGITLPSVWQWLILAVVVGVTWLYWPHVPEPRVDSGSARNAITASFENLRIVEGIARTGSHGVPRLVDGLANSDFRLRRNALLALRLVGPEAVGALDSVRERFADDDAMVRAHAIEAYWFIRRDPDDVSQALAPLLGDPEADVREEVAKILESIGPLANGPVVELLRINAFSDRRPALAVLRRIGWDASQPQIEEALNELAHDPEVRIDALQAIALWGHPTATQIRQLLQQPESVDNLRRMSPMEPGPREVAVAAIIRKGPDATENLNDLLDLLEQSQRGGRLWTPALAAIRTMKTAARPAAQRLLQLASDEDYGSRIDLGWTLLAIGADPHEIVGIVIPVLREKDSDYCFHAGRLCAIASPEEARRQVSQLIPLLVPEKLDAGLSALNAVWGLAPQAQQAVPALSRLLAYEQSHVASIAAKSLGVIGPAAASAIPELEKQLARGVAVHGNSVRRAFYEAIGKMGSAASGAIPNLLVELNHAPLERAVSKGGAPVDRPPVGKALSALSRIRYSDPKVLAAIRRHLNNKDPTIQLSALGAMAQLNANSAEVLECYLKWLQDNRTSDRFVDLILTVGRWTGDRQAAVPVLGELLSGNAIPEHRKAAACALGMIGSEASAGLPALREAIDDWKNSQYPRRAWHSMHRSDSPRNQLDLDRWIDSEDLRANGSIAIQLMDKSVQQVAREAIKLIEADTVGGK